MRVDETNFETLQRAYDITGLHNEIMWKDAENIDGYIDSDYVMDLLDAMIDEYNSKRDELQDLEYQMQEYYEPKKIDPYYEYGVSERDFH